jgi:hypothetical protein
VDQEGELFLGQPLLHLSVPDILVDASIALALLACAGWAALRLHELARGELALGHALYLSSHFAVFAAAYLWIDSLSLGWLVINTWHNVQYLLFSWHAGDLSARSESPLVPIATALRGGLAGFLVLCAALSTAMYAALHVFPPSLILLGLPAATIAGHAINFHHYLSDARIWRKGAPGLSPA